MQINLQKGKAMGMQVDPDETDCMDLAVAEHELIAFCSADGVITPEEDRLIRLLRLPRERLTRRYRIRRNLESILRNGLNRYTRRNAQDADITFLFGSENQLLDVVQIDDRELAAA